MNNSQDLNLKWELNLRSHYQSCGSCFHVSKDFITVGVQSSVLAFEVTIRYRQSLMSCTVVSVKRVHPQTMNHGRWWNEEPLTIFDLYHDVSMISEKIWKVVVFAPFGTVSESLRWVRTGQLQLGRYLLKKALKARLVDVWGRWTILLWTAGFL